MRGFPVNITAMARRLFLSSKLRSFPKTTIFASVATTTLVYLWAYPPTSSFSYAVSKSGQLGKPQRVFRYNSEAKLQTRWKPIPSHGAIEEVPSGVVPQAQLPWQPLKSFEHIRLLTILPGSGDFLHCKLEETSFCEAPPFEAVSYCRTMSDGERKISCSGFETTITQSLHDALFTIRNGHEERVVWVDTLCINQQDKEEISWQVRMIGDVFRHASGVLIYLGPSSSKTEGALDVIRQVVHKQALGLHASKFDALVNLFALPWFERLWIVQELCQAKKALVFHGNDTLPWDDVAATCACLHQILHRSALPFSGPLRAIERVHCLETIRKTVRQSGIGLSLLDLIRATSNFKVTNPRDRIFALTGLAQDVTDSDWEVAPDYLASVEDVYTRFALWNLAKRGDLRLLSLCPSPAVVDVSEKSLPSWVPDLSTLNLTETPALLALSDEPVDAAKYVQAKRRRVEFYPDRETEYVCKAPEVQWECADGISRPLRPSLRASWFFQNEDAEENFYGLPKARFSRNNKVLHLTGEVVDCVEAVGNPAFYDFEILHRDLGTLFLSAVKDHRWQAEECEQLLRITTDVATGIARWLAECWEIAAKATLDESRFERQTPQIHLWHSGGRTSGKREFPYREEALGYSEDDKIVGKKESFWHVLTCSRLLSGLPAPEDCDGKLLDLMEVRDALRIRSDGTLPNASTSGIAGFDTLVTYVGRPAVNAIESWSKSKPALVGPHHTRTLPAAFFPSARHADDFLRLLRQGQFSFSNEQSLLENVLDPSMRMVARNMYPVIRTWSAFRCFGRTKGGRLANVPDGAKSGDLICVFLGASVPYILRPVGGGFFTLIGECYVQGVMEGQAAHEFRQSHALLDARWIPRRLFAIK